MGNSWRVGGERGFEEGDLVMVADQAEAGVGGSRGRAAADEKGAGRFFQRLDPLADGRRGDVKLGRRKVERAAAVDGGKGGKLGRVKH